MTVLLDWSPFTKTQRDLSFSEEREKARLNDLAAQMRLNVMRTMIRADYGHPASCLGLCDLFTALYFGGVMKYSISRPAWDKRDRLVVSCGHISALLYTALSMAGYLSGKDLDNYARAGGPGGHPQRCVEKGIENSSGSLGQGVGIAFGLALALQKTGQKVFLISSDGEQQEGQVWEAYHAAIKYNLSNLIVFVDENGIQNSGTTLDVMPSGNLKKKFNAFDFNVISLENACAFNIVRTLKTLQSPSKPSVIVLKTTAGKGVSFMENNPFWHDGVPRGKLKEQALKELNEQKRQTGLWLNFLNKME